MDFTALSNSLFVDLRSCLRQEDAGAVMPRQFNARGVETGKLQEKSLDSPAVDDIVTAEQNPVRDSEEVEFRDALDEQNFEQENEEGRVESDKPVIDNVANYLLATAGVLTANVEAVSQEADVIEISPEQKALAVLTYLKDAQLLGNPGNANEAIGEVVEKMLGRTSNEQVVDPMIDQGTETSEGTLEAVLPQQPEAQVAQEQTGQVQQSVNTDGAVATETAEPEQSGEKTELAVGEAVSQATQINVGKETEGIDSEQAQAGIAPVLNREVVVDSKTTGQDNTDTKGQAQQGQVERVVDAVKGEVKDSGDKATFKNELGSNLQEDNAGQAVINADTADKGAEVSKTLEQPNQTQFGKEIFDKAGEQLGASISNTVRQGQEEVTVRLNPPELGRVVIKLQQDNGQITGLLEFSKAETKAEMQQLLPQLVRNLQDAGIAVRKLDVVQTQIDNSGQQQFREHVGQNGMTYQQQFSQGQSSGFGAGYDWVSGESVYSGPESLAEAYISDQAVNVLV